MRVKDACVHQFPRTENMVMRERRCTLLGCGRVLVNGNQKFCSQSHAMRHQRAQQTPEERSALGRRAQQAQGQDILQRLLARVKCFADTEDARIVLAWRLGKMAAKSRRYKLRRHRRQARGAA